MKLIGLLSWWDEPVEDLEQAIRGYHACGITNLLAVDGAYGLFPGATRTSSQAEHDTIARVCDELSIDWWCYVPLETWKTETDKRGFMFACAEGTFDTRARDWYVVIDADEKVLNPFDLRPRLKATRLSAAELHMIEPAGGGNKARKLDIRKIFRALPGLTVRHNHHTYMTPQGRVLWGFGQEEALDLADLQVEHFTNLRPANRRELKKAYYDARDEHGIEEQIGCYVCNAKQSIYQIKSGFSYNPAKVEIRSSWHRACVHHVDALWQRNRSDLARLVMPHIVAETVKVAPRDWQLLVIDNPARARHVLAVMVSQQIKGHEMDIALGLGQHALVEYAQTAVDAACPSDGDLLQHPTLAQPAPTLLRR